MPIEIGKHPSGIWRRKLYNSQNLAAGIGMAGSLKISRILVQTRPITKSENSKWLIGTEVLDNCPPPVPVPFKSPLEPRARLP